MKITKIIMLGFLGVSAASTLYLCFKSEGFLFYFFALLSGVCIIAFEKVRFERKKISQEEY